MWVTSNSGNCFLIFVATPVKNTRIPTLTKKIPDFQNIHKKQFAKMESLVENQQRKQERARFLMSPMSAKVRQSNFRLYLAHVISAFIIIVVTLELTP